MQNSHIRIFDLTEEDEEMMSSGTGALPVTISDWSSMTNARIAPPSIMSAASAFDLTVSGVQNSLRSVLPTSTIGHAPMLANRSLSQPAPLSPTSLDPDRRSRMRRQIANCNERRRMQSINAGFMALRALLPRKEGEKLSKAAILQQTADMVHQLLLQKGDDFPDGGEPKNLNLKFFISEDHQDADQHAQIAHLQTVLESERAARKALENQVIQLRELLQMTTTSSQSTSPVTPRSNGSGFSLPYHSSTLPTSLRESPERKPSFHDSTSTPLSLLTLNGSPTSSESITSQRVLPPPTLPSLETTVIRPTPLPPISVEVSSPSLSTPSPLTAAAPIIFSTAPPQSSILFQTAVTSAMSTGNSTPVAMPHHLQGHNSAFVSTQPNMTLSQSMQTIVEAIRHLEGSHFMPTSPPPTSQTSLVR
uniref:BHLH domain-containing protein n=1 Tax=Caenorhabditis tropicalis TaxID=1561998 RepID=A0A1I7UQJ4_9PELO